MSQKIRIKLKSYDYKLVDKSAEKIVKAVGHRCNCQRSYPPAHTQAHLHREPFDLRQQEGPRTVPAL